MSDDEKNIINAINYCFKEDKYALIEEEISGREISVGVIKYNNKILHQSKIINYFIQEKPSKKKTEKDLNNFLKKIKKSKNNYLITKDVIVIESLKFDGIKINEEYGDLYTINENTMPIDIQVLINDGEIGLAMLRIIEIIGEDELKNLGSETLYFLVNALNQMDIDLIRNEILSAILPVRV